MPSLDRDGEVFVLNLGDGENRFNADSVAALGALLDEVEKAAGPKALVTCATGKTWSLGLDLDWIRDNAAGVVPFIGSVQALLARVLVMPVPTVAALQGHTFAAGAMLALAHDFRVMRSDRGFFCLPEVDINIPFSAGMSALIQAKLTHRAAHESMATGRRYGGTDALSEGIVHEVVSEDKVLEAAVARARGLASKDGATLGTIKRTMYARQHQSLLDLNPEGLGVLLS
jgi:enoyl-CoA hydratase/carnithine racemase